MGKKTKDEVIITERKTEPKLSLVKTTNWKIEENTINCCGVIEDAKVLLELDIHLLIAAMLKEMDNEEFIAYLCGEVKDYTFVITDIYIPKQEVSVAAAEAKEEAPLDAIGILHSHHSMGTFFSHTDNEYANANHNLSIVVAYDKDQIKYKATARLQAPCGYNLRTEIPVIINYGYYAKWAEEQRKAKIEKKSYLIGHVGYGVMRSKCETCNGSGILANSTCPICRGTGWQWDTLEC